MLTIVHISELELEKTGANFIVCVRIISLYLGTYNNIQETYGEESLVT